MKSTNRHLLCLFFLLGLSAGAKAQSNGTNSSYSRYGLGLLQDQSQGFNRGMGGVAQGLAGGSIVNMQNPASYSRIDSLTFLMDAGLGMSFGRYKQGGNTLNVRNATLEYVNTAFRLRRGMGMSIGYVPFTAIGYNFSHTTNVGTNADSQKDITTTNTYNGDGGLHRLYVGWGWNPFADLSIGVNASYVWGQYNHTRTQSFSEGSTTNSSYSGQNMAWKSSIRTYKIDLGVQYPIRLGKQDLLTVGATVGLGHGIGSKVEMTRFTPNADTLRLSTHNAFELPYTIAAGASWQHRQRWTVAADYEMQRWEGLKSPLATSSDAGYSLEVRTDQYLTRHSVRLGLEYQRNPNPTNKFRDRIRYRLGANYHTPYVRLAGTDGPTQYSLTAGVALPLTNSGRSMLNLGVEWMRRQPALSAQITENYLMLHVGITFNERWFMKWRIE